LGTRDIEMKRRTENQVIRWQVTRPGFAFGYAEARIRDKSAEGGQVRITKIESAPPEAGKHRRIKIQNENSPASNILPLIYRASAPLTERGVDRCPEEKEQQIKWKKLKIEMLSPDSPQCYS
jgi:hypothetical protein